ncbi:MAG: hypothetical protein ACK559_09225, partial [bacterium]
MRANWRLPGLSESLSMRVGRAALGALAGGDLVTIFVGFFLVTGGYGLSLLGDGLATIDLFNRRFVRSIGGIKYVSSDLSLGSRTGNHFSDIDKINHRHYIRYEIYT